MSGAKHTPGPWTIVGERDWQDEKIDDFMIVACDLKRPDSDDCDFICNIGGPAGPVYADDETGARHSADAHLIAAAPTMYEALRAYDDDVCECYVLAVPSGSCASCIVRAALALARGEQP